MRAAYRALIRRYHPDANRSAEAAERARAINAAYAVLGDPGRRADYDASRACRELPPPRPNRAGPIFTGLIWAVALGLLLYAIQSPPGAVDELEAAPAAAAIEAAAPEPVAPPEPKRIAAAAADKDSAARPVRATDVAALSEMPPAEAPMQVAAAAAAERRPPAAAGRRQAAPAGEPAAAPRPAAARSSTPAQAPSPARASFDCRFASGPGEKAVCGDSNLAFLDGRMAVLYGQSWGQADEARRAMLLETRAGFVERRDRCGSESCIADAYLKRMREISDIMGGRGPPR